MLPWQWPSVPLDRHLEYPVPDVQAVIPPSRVQDVLYPPSKRTPPSYHLGPIDQQHRRRQHPSADHASQQRR